MITDTEIRFVGVRVLREALGDANAEKFISLILREPFDYTAWQREMWTDKSVEEVSRNVMAHRQSQVSR